MLHEMDVDILELDALIGDVLLASRLDASTVTDAGPGIPTPWHEGDALVVDGEVSGSGDGCKSSRIVQ